jgi:hypothetical protein
MFDGKEHADSISVSNIDLSGNPGDEEAIALIRGIHPVYDGIKGKKEKKKSLVRTTVGSLVGFVFRHTFNVSPTFKHATSSSAWAASA